MSVRTMVGGVLAASLLALTVACAPSTPGDSATPGSASPGSGTGDTRLAFGLHHRADGTVDAVGKLQRIELEGGFHALTGVPGESDIIVVIANASAFDTEIAALVGTDVQAHGTLSDDASIRMAGPEIVIDSIQPW